MQSTDYADCADSDNDVICGLASGLRNQQIILLTYD